MRPHGRAQVNSRSPRAHALCDKCQFTFNHDELVWQYEWAGPKLQNQRILVCYECNDTPQEQLRTIVLPPDPVPIHNPRPENYIAADNPISTLGSDEVSLLTPIRPPASAPATPSNRPIAFGNITQGGGLNSIFDSNLNKPFGLCATKIPSVAGLNNMVGKNWGTGVTYAVSSFTLYGPNNGKIFGGGVTSFTLQGSSDANTWNNLASSVTVGTVGETITTTCAPAQYQYHRLLLTGDGVNTVALAQLQMMAA